MTGTGTVPAQPGAARQTGALLAAGWDDFERLRVLTSTHADPASASYPAMMMAAAAAAAGRDAVGHAPSMPAGPAAAAPPAPPGPDPAGLAAGLAARMSQAAAEAAAPADQAAFRQAAGQASAICDLLEE